MSRKNLLSGCIAPCRLSATSPTTNTAMKIRILFGTLSLITSILGAQGKTITVNTANNISPGVGQTNLVQAINLLADGDTVAFNIPGTPGAVVYLQTPPGGYPIITNNNVTVDGYSQPGATPNTNPIHAANNAKIKICLDSRNGNGTDMGTIADIAGVPGSFGFGHDEWAVLGVFRGTNVHIKGFGVLSAPANPSADIKSFSFGRDYVGSCANWHVSGCWIGVDPADGQIKFIDDGVSVTNIATPAIAIAAYRHRDSAGQNAVYPQPGIIGVAAGSANPRAEFNVIITGYGFDSEGLNYRIAGNFFGVLPDGMTNVDMSLLLDGAQLGDGFIEIGRDVSNCIIGTDGDGVNDADEGNVFGGFAVSGAVMMDLYSSPQTNIVIAGNWFGLAVDGVKRFTNNMAVVDGFNGQSTARIGSDFDGVSDALEANVIAMNYPFDVLFPNPAGVVPENLLILSTGARVSFRGNRLLGENIAPFSYAIGSGNRLLAFTNFYAPFLETNQIIPVLSSNSNQGLLRGTCALGVPPYTNIIIDVYAADEESWTNGVKFQMVELSYSDPITMETKYNGFPNGKTYLGSFVDNGPKDLDPVAGQFTLDIGSLGLNTSTLVTVAANYSADPPGTHQGRTHTSVFANPITLAIAPRMTIARSGANVLVSWATNAGTFSVQSTPQFGPTAWANLAPQPPITVVGTNYQATIPISGTRSFIRLAR